MRIAFLFILFLFCLDHTWAQTDFEVPSEIKFANQQIKFTDAYKEKIKLSANNLLKNNKYFRLTVERADAYFGIVERVLLQSDAPDDLKYLSLQESKLISDVVSSSNAVGYWQFKKETAQEMGLRVDEEIDERMHIISSSVAAAKYLKRHNQYMNNWIYSILSYYAGLGGAKKLIDPSLIGATEMTLDTNTHWYITQFIAHKLAYENAIHRNPQPPIQILEYTECENKTLDAIALENNVNLEDLRWYNKWARNGIIPSDRDYTVIIPIVQPQPGLLALTNVPDPATSGSLKPYEETRFFGLIKVKQEPTTATPIATVQPDGSIKYAYESNVTLFFSWNGIKAIMAKKGDNIAKLALQADLDKSDFLAFNDMRIFDLIVPGQVYYVRSKKKKAKVPFHTVMPNQTLWEISQEYGISMKWLLKRNRMEKPEALRPGRVLWMRQTRPENTPIEYKNIVLPPPLPLKKEDSTKQATIRKSITAHINNTTDSQSVKTAEIEEDTAISKVQIYLDEEKKKENQASKNGFKTTYLKEGQSLFSLITELNVPLDSIYSWNAGQIVREMPIYYKDLKATLSISPIPADTVSTTKLETKIITPEKQDSAKPKVIELPKPTKVEPIKVAIKPASVTKDISNTNSVNQEAAFHIVGEKETLYRISKQYQTTVAEILRLNGKTEPTLKVGEKLRVK